MFDIVNIFPQFLKNIRAGFSCKQCCNLSFKWPGENVLTNRRKFFSQMNLDLEKLIMPEQVHSNKIFIVNQEHCGQGALKKDWLVGVDGIVCQKKDIIIGIETADCLPIFAYDSVANVIGIAHAGWRGVVSGVAVELVKKMKQLGSVPANINIEIGPHIRQCCFEVKKDVADKFSNFPEAVRKEGEKNSINLGKIVSYQLTSAGILDKNIECSNECTCCNGRFYSFRREKEFCRGGMLGFISMI